MIYLNASTAKIDLIKILENESDKHESLYLIIDSLPTFLNTPIAFTVFNYQISRYPRKIFWWSYEPRILDFLKSCTAAVSDPVNDKTLSSDQNILIKYSPSSPALIPASAKNFDVKEQLDTTPDKHVFSAQDILNENKYVPLDLINDLSKNTTQKLESTNLKEGDYQGVESFSAEMQNFDSWIKKIEATKSALYSLKNNSDHETFTKNVSQLPKRGSKVFKVLTLSLVLSLVFAFSIILLPAKVYTIELGSISKESGADLDLNITDFSKSSNTLSARAEIQPRGTKEVPTDLSTGEVSLINEGNRAVNLDNGLFRLVIAEKYYQVLPDNTLPRSFSIPTKAESSKILKFKIQATDPGSEYNLPINTQLDIVNLQGAGKRVCSSCYAVTVTDIKNTKVSGQQIVTEYDQSFIVQSVEAKLALQRSEAIKNIQRSKVFTNEEWYKNTDSKYNFNTALNEPADLLKLDTTVSTDIYYLTQEQLEKSIRSQNKSIKSFKDIAIIDIQNNPRTSDKIKLKVFFTYETENTCLDKQKFLSTLSVNDFEEAKKQILIDCPGVLNIEKRDVGINMPGISPRVDLTVTGT
jgi:hypothetical protein